MYVLVCVFLSLSIPLCLSLSLHICLCVSISLSLSLYTTVLESVDERKKTEERKSCPIQKRKLIKGKVFMRKP